MGAGDAVSIAVPLREASRAIRLRIDGLSVWLAPVVAFDEAAGQWVWHGRASRDLDAVTAVAAPEALGAWRIISARRFEARFSDAALAKLALGQPVSVALMMGQRRDVVTMALGGRWTEFTGRGIWVAARLQEADTDEPALIARTWSSDCPSTAEWGGAALAVEPDGRARRVRLPLDVAVSGSRQGFDFSVTRRCPGEALRHKRARLAWGLTWAGLRASDADEEWALGCTDALRACLDGAARPERCGRRWARSLCAAESFTCGAWSPYPGALTPMMDPAQTDAGWAADIDATSRRCAGVGETCALHRVHVYEAATCREPRAALVAWTSDVDARAPLYPQTDPQTAPLWEAAALRRDRWLRHGLDGRVLGPSGGEAFGMALEGERPCHNCSLYDRRLLIYRPDAGRLYVFDGLYGFDS